MRQQLQFIQGSLSDRFPKYTESLWVSKNLFPQLIEQDIRFVQVSCREPLQEFTLFLKLEFLNTEVQTEIVYINPNILPKKHIDDNLPVIIELLDIDKLTQASSVTIEVPKDSVVHWSADDIRFTANLFKTQHRIAYLGQSIFLKSDTSKIVQGTIQSIYPKSNTPYPYIIKEDTPVLFEGFPENRQKTIDFSKIGGLDQVIATLRNIIQIPMAYPELIVSFGINPPKGMLLYGPPGNGKTLLARAIAQSMGAGFIAIEGPELNSKYVGEGERRLRDKFEEAKGHKHCVLFIDEIDAIASSRDKDNTPEYQITTVATLLNLMDGMQSSQGIFVIGATNRLSAVDRALRRPGRFELEFEVPLPDQKARLDILNKTFDLNRNSRVSSGVNLKFLEQVSERTHGYSGADLVSLYRQSVMNAISKQLKFDSNTAKFNLKKENYNILLEPSDVWDTMKKMVPTSSRGLGKTQNPLAWESLLAVEKEKEVLEGIHQKMDALQEMSPTQHLNFMNIMVLGKQGSGRRTTWHSFAKTFHYEWCFLDALDYNRNHQGFLDAWEEALERAKKLAPSILYVNNYSFLEDKIVISEKVKNSLSQLPASYQLLCVIALQNENEREQSHLVGYKGFNQNIHFQNKLKERDYKILSETYALSIADIQKIKGGKKTIGEIIEAIEKEIYQL